ESERIIWTRRPARARLPARGMTRMLNRRRAIVIVTLASYNIHKAEGLDRRTDLPRIAHVLKEIDADLIGVQEVFRPQAEALADSLGMRMIMGATLNDRGLAYGNAVLTRLPIQASYTFDLSRPDRQPRGGMRL